jgi:putative FmdB family regulatory protein
MPIYEYQCEQCQVQFEALVPFEHRDEAACEACGVAAATRLASTFASGTTAMATSPSTSTGNACCGGACRCCGD